MNKFLQIFKERGFFHQCTDEQGLGSLPNFTAYIGFDLTANSLHVGSLLQIMILRWLKKTGNTPIILLGGATTKVGDPSGKDESRPVLDEQKIEENKRGIAGVFKQFGLGECKIVDNSDWLDGLKYIEFLRDVGRHFSVNRMIARDSVKQRLERESHMSFLEFNYMILQAYDFVKLAENYDCRVQIGGSDQWGNIVEGTNLHHSLGALNGSMPRSVGQGDSKEMRYWIESNGDRISEEFSGESEVALALQEHYNNWKLYGLTTPLITTSTGAKMGKTAAGAVWLSAEKTSPYEYYQFWRNTDDADVIRFLKMFTELEIAEIEAMKAWEGSAKINDAKKILAFEATKICHGEAAAIAAQNAAIEAFEKGGTEGLPEVVISREVIHSECSTSVLFSTAFEISRSDARRLIEGGGAKIDDQAVLSPVQEVKISDGMKLSSGKKKHVILRVF